MFTGAIQAVNNSFTAGTRACGLVVGILAALSTAPSWALAYAAAATPLSVASAPITASAVTPAKSPAAVKISAKSAWQDLTPSQQISLKPLAAQWNTLGETQKRKWITIAANYSSLAPAEQAKLHSRMTEWVSLSQQQRAQARLNFAQSKQHTATEKASTWQAYQALSPEEKQKLAISAPKKPVGAAAAAKPVPAQKLAKVPVTRQSQKPTPKVPATTYAINRNTLLPQSQPAGEPAPTQKH